MSVAERYDWEDGPNDALTMNRLFTRTLVQLSNV